MAAAVNRDRWKKTEKHKQRIAGSVKAFQDRRRRALLIMAQLERDGVVVAVPTDLSDRH